MSLIKCPECGKEISEMATACPNCGCPNVYNNQNQNTVLPKPEVPQNVRTSQIHMNQQNNVSNTEKKKKDSILSMFAFLISLFGFAYISTIGFILALIDIKRNDKSKQHGWSYAAIGVYVCWVFLFMLVNSGTDSETATAPIETSKKQVNSTKTEAKDKYKVGDTWSNEYVLVSYDKRGEYVSDNEFIQPADGYKYICATFTFENIGSSDETVAYWDFSCYADGYACEGMYGTDDAAFSQTLSSGRKITGTVYFEVPQKSKSIELEYSPSFWTSEKVTFVYK